MFYQQVAPGTAIVIRNAKRSSKVEIYLAALKESLDSHCRGWLENAYSNSDWKVYGSFDNFLTNILPESIGSGDFTKNVDGAKNTTDNAVTGGAVPGFAILFNNYGDFFVNNGANRIVAPGISHTINSASDQARSFIMLHELGHLFGLTRPDYNNPGAQRANNQDVWNNCHGTITSFSNTSRPI